MSNITLFLIQISLCFSIGMAVIALLKPHLTDVLTETCGTAKRAAFWVIFTQLMLVIAPLLLVVFFTDAKPGIHAYPAEAIKDTLFQSLFGIFIAITMVGQVIWKPIAADSGMTTREETTAPVLEAE